MNKIATYSLASGRDVGDATAKPARAEPPHSFSASAKVIEIVRNPLKETGVFYHLQDDNREMVTVIECICADGSSVPPSIIYRSVGDVEKTWFETPEGFQEGALYGRSPNGWTSNLIALEWLKRHFGPGSATMILQSRAPTGIRSPRQIVEIATPQM